MGLVKSITDAVGLTGSPPPVRCGLAEIDYRNGQEKNNNFLSFQYFPETIEDTKNPNYSVKSIPGGSHPIRQFVDGGDRNISFVALFVNDDNPDKSGDSLAGQLSGSLGLNNILSGNKRKDSVDIAGALAWLRSYTYPEYKNNVALAPPVLRLYIPGSGIIGNGKFQDSLSCVLTNCTVTYEVFHRNGTPRVVTVSLTFAEMINYYAGWSYVSRDSEAFQNGIKSYGKAEYAKGVIPKQKKGLLQF